VGTLPKEVGLMPSMDWDAFQRDHHRPHLLVIEAKKKARGSRWKGDP